MDSVECGEPSPPCVDSDNDGVPDYLDLDSDDDGILDSVEGHDANGDGQPDVLPQRCRQQQQRYRRCV
ncbi:MAG: hypothetical protein R3A47_05415 [Polyangiales bacterium]